MHIDKTFALCSVQYLNHKHKYIFVSVVYNRMHNHSIYLNILRYFFLVFVLFFLLRRFKLCCVVVTFAQNQTKHPDICNKFQRF